MLNELFELLDNDQQLFVQFVGRRCRRATPFVQMKQTGQSERRVPLVRQRSSEIGQLPMFVEVFDAVWQMVTQELVEIVRVDELFQTPEDHRRLVVHCSSR